MAFIAYKIHIKFFLQNYSMTTYILTIINHDQCNDQLFPFQCIHILHISYSDCNKSKFWMPKFIPSHKQQAIQCMDLSSRTWYENVDKPLTKFDKLLFVPMTLLFSELPLFNFCFKFSK